MSFKFDEVPGGWAFENPNAFVFFGNRDSQLPRLQQLYPQFQFRRVKQVHGDKIVENSAQIPDWTLEADGHFTSEKNLALCSISADCMPLLWVSRQRPWVMALHAGWRGVAQRLAPKALDVIKRQGLEIEDFDLYIGPHIMNASFEIRQDAFELLRKSTSASSELFSTPQGEGCYKLNLLDLVTCQLRESNFPQDQIHCLEIDTVTEPQLHSFRRDAKDAGRQISFVVIKLSP